MRFLLRLSPRDMGRDEFLASVRSLARSVGSEARNPKWTSKGALEIDVFSPSRADFNLVLPVLEPISSLEFARDLNIAPPHMSEVDMFNEAWAYFNQERYWECHEVLEGIWRTKSGEEKSLLQGIILVCAAFVHHQKGEDGVALGVMKRALKQLTSPEGTYHGVDLTKLEKSAEDILTSERFVIFQV